MKSSAGLLDLEKLSSAIVNGLGRLGKNIHLQAIQRGLLISLPLVFIGAMSLCILNFPSQLLNSLFESVFGPDWRAIFEGIVQGSFGIASLAVVCGVSFNLALLSNERNRRYYVSPSMATMVALSCFIVLSGHPDTWENLFSLNSGLIFAVTTAIGASVVLKLLASCRFIRIQFSIIGHDPFTSQILSLLPAGILTIFLCAMARLAFLRIFPEGMDVPSLLMGLFFEDKPGGFGLGVLYLGVSQLLWFLGIHGPNVLFSLEQSTLNVAMLENIRAFLAGAPPPHILTKGFLDAFAYMGGSGATLSLILAVLVKSKDPGNRRLCIFALLPAMCNVNEPLLFGIPIVFNPLYLIPFLLAPLLNMFIAYAATVLELVPRTIASVHWTTPALVSGYFTTGSLAGALLQIVNLIMGTLVYAPFVLLSERILNRKLQESLDTLTNHACDAVPGPGGHKCLSRPGLEGLLAKSLTDNLVQALKRGDQLFLVYQPQINTRTNRVEGVECLLRWKHPTYGLIPPTVAVALAEDCGVIDDLGVFVLQQACTSLLQWKTAIDDDFLISVNLSARQLENPKLVDYFLETLHTTGLPAHHLEVEITESVAATPNGATYETLFKFRELGLKVAIDDFGMGHTSLRYLKEFPIDTIKLDKSLTEETNNGVNDHIVKSILSLSQGMNLRTIVEGVETLVQCEKFNNLGFHIFQGYYFSKPLARGKCYDFIRSYGRQDAVLGY